MERTPWQQVHELLLQESSFLIALPKQPSTDAIASGLALLLLLQKMGKQATVVSDNFTLPETHAFLRGSETIQPVLAAGQKFVITLNLGKTQVADLSYDIAGEQLQIFITPKDGMPAPHDVTATETGQKFGLIIVLDAQDLESLGSVFDSNTELFYGTPVVNIDHRASNTNFGQVNVVELTATSTSEVLFSLLRDMDENFLDEHIATNLLAGIISKTRSFQSSNVTPKSLAVASHLIASGARRDEIIRHLYQTKSLATLRLWGRVLSRLKADHGDRFLFSRLSREELGQTKAKSDDLAGVIDELIVDAPKAEIIALLYQDENDVVEALVHTVPALNGVTLFRDFLPEGTRDFMRLRFSGVSLEEAEKRLVSRVGEHYRPA